MKSLPKEEVIDRYTSGESTVKIAEDLDCSQATVSRRLDRWGIEKRDAGYYARVEYAQFRTTNTGHEVWRCRVGDGQKSIPVHRLLAVSEHGFDAVCGKVVHHKNEIPWDNRPENIEIMGESEHVSKHMTGHSHNEHWTEMKRDEHGRFA